MGGRVIVFDIGKTMSKLTLWSSTGELIERRTRTNIRVLEKDVARLDVGGIDAFLIDTLSEFARMGPVDAIIPVAHGAAVAIVRNGRLTEVPFDYEQPIPSVERVRYEQERDDFALTGSPALPDGLNLGAQLHLIEALRPGALAGATLLLWPQYWAWRLSGVAASEVTSLGCHTDLWLPTEGRPSPLAVRRGWAAKMPALRQAGDVLGTLTAEMLERTGLGPETRVYCGLHDSNAALLAARAFPEMGEEESTILSTGTWFVAMRTPAPGARVDIARLPAERDCLVNVDAFGRAVPSARFMGGREIETLTGIDTRRIDIVPDQPSLVAALPKAIAGGAMVLPTFAAGFGPFPHARGRWLSMPTDQAERRAAVSLYAALMADVSLDLIGARDQILVEGRFAEAQVFVRSLAALRPDARLFVANAHNDVSFGALRLILPDLKPSSSLTPVAPIETDVRAYRSRWQAQAEQMEMAS